MARVNVWDFTEINSRAIAIQYFSLWFIHFLEGTDIASYAAKPHLTMPI